MKHALISALERVQTKLKRESKETEIFYKVVRSPFLALLRVLTPSSFQWDGKQLGWQFYILRLDNEIEFSMNA